MTGDSLGMERPVAADRRALPRGVAARLESAGRGFRTTRIGAGRGGANPSLLGPKPVVFPLGEFRRHRRQLDVGPDCGSRHVRAADRRLCRPFHRQHDGADRHHRRQGCRSHAGCVSRRRRRTGSWHPARPSQRHPGAPAEHLAADRDPCDAGALWRIRLRRQQHGGLRLSPIASRARAGQGVRYPVYRDDRGRRLPDRLVRPDPHGHGSSHLCHRRRPSCRGTLRHSGRPAGRWPLRRQRVPDRTCRRAGRGPARQHHADHRVAL